MNDFVAKMQESDIKQDETVLSAAARSHLRSCAGVGQYITGSRVDVAFRQASSHKPKRCDDANILRLATQLFGLPRCVRYFPEI